MSRFMKFLVPKNPLLWRVPHGQFQQERADSRFAGTHQMILIRQMYARNTKEADLLLNKYNARTAYEVIDAINRQKPSVRLRLERSIKKLVRRIEGSTLQKPRMKPRTFSRLPRQLHR